MKTLLALTLAVFTAQAAQASTLKCASKKDEHLYYTDGQLLLVVKKVAGETLLLDSSLSLRPEGKLGSNDAKLEGSITGTGKWIRFSMYGDAWCSYRLALPRGFTEKTESFPAFVDAYCEENSNYTVRMNCRLD